MSLSSNHGNFSGSNRRDDADPVTSADTMWMAQHGRQRHEQSSIAERKLRHKRHLQQQHDVATSVISATSASATSTASALKRYQRWRKLASASAAFEQQRQATAIQQQPQSCLTNASKATSQRQPARRHHQAKCRSLRVLTTAATMHRQRQRRRFSSNSSLVRCFCCSQSPTAQYHQHQRRMTTRAAAAFYSPSAAASSAQQQQPHLQFQQKRLRDDVSGSERTKTQQQSAQYSLRVGNFSSALSVSDITLHVSSTAAISPASTTTAALRA